MIVYFSGTGNSRYAAQMIADACDDKLIDAGEYIEEEGKIIAAARPVLEQEIEQIRKEEPLAEVKAGLGMETSID